MRLPAYLSLGLFGCLLLGPFLGGVHAQTCPFPKCLIYNGNCYCCIHKERTWSQAQDRCESFGGHLASIHHSMPYEIICGRYEDVWVGPCHLRAASNWGAADICTALRSRLDSQKCVMKSCFEKLPFLCEMDLWNTQ
ncbi:hypothetical protein lerEdw1_013441 [Lerista edwardsae]|nr:hypothetical protein lerEdw1_013443 [Lerista edwardsae]KAJ6650280.1 hypothetical protein lerEdw1_013441 [Lerista edwardsae]